MQYSDHVSSRFRTQNLSGSGKLRRTLGLCAVVGICGLLSSATIVADSKGALIDPEKLKLTFNEEFDTLDVSAWGPGTRWISHTPWSGDFGGARFADPDENSPFSIDSGILRIEATRDEAGNWRSGLLASVDRKGIGFSQKYGYFEIRAQLPEGAGVWPAFWLVGKDRSKATAEIDVLEYYGDKPGAYSSVVHVWHKNGEHYSKGNRNEVFAEAQPSDFHIYGVKVDKEFIRMYFDRKLVWTTQTQPEHRQRLFILLNLALVDGTSNIMTPDPSHMFIDYVRAYALEADNAALP
jgi:beta-glucanase (GH16 family)